jgi:hypothetical protein
MGTVKFAVALCALAAICWFVIRACDSSQSSPATTSQPAGTEAPNPGTNWIYTVESADDLIKSEIINNKITLTPYAKSLGFHVRKNASGNYSVQTLGDQVKSGHT